MDKNISKLEIIPYFMNKRYYFRIEVEALIEAKETKSYDMKVELRTSVESRFENNMLSQSGWIDNPNTTLQ